MRFDPEQEELRRTVRTLLERAAGGDVWRLLAEQVGAHALAIPEEYGGAGFSVLETHVVLEELGAALAAPAFSSTTLAAQAILAGDDEGAKARLLPGIAAGESVATLAWAESGSWEVGAIAASAAQGDDGMWRVSGTKEHVLDGADADLFLVPARIRQMAPANSDDQGGSPTGAFAKQQPRVENQGDSPTGQFAKEQPQVENHGGSPTGLVAKQQPRVENQGGSSIGLFAVEAAQADVRRQDTVDPNRPQAGVEFRDSPATLLLADAASALDHLLDLACVALAAEQVGAAQRALDMTVAYAKQRVQFGRPIGSFQAVKHRLADMFTLVESARSAAHAAAVAAASGHDLTVAAARAKAYCSEAFSTVVGEAVQLHGGIGITWEHPIHLYFKRAHATSQLFGSPAAHRRRYARAIGLAA